MRISIETDQYNERRYGKPWIARVFFDKTSKAIFSFGNWVGAVGYDGILEIDVEEGDIVARGQKDFRKPRNSAPSYYIVDKGELVSTSKKDAYLSQAIG